MIEIMATTSEHPVRILMVEDYEEIASCFKRLSKHLHANWDITVEVDGARAYDHLLSPAEYDVIFLDIILPNMNGLEIYMRLSTLAPNRIPRTIFISGALHHAVISEFVEAHQATLLEKPVTNELIAEHIARLAALDLPRGP